MRQLLLQALSIALIKVTRAFITATSSFAVSSCQRIIVSVPPSAIKMSPFDCDFCNFENNPDEPIIKFAIFALPSTFLSHGRLLFYACIVSVKGGAV